MVVLVMRWVLTAMLCYQLGRSVLGVMMARVHLLLNSDPIVAAMMRWLLREEVHGRWLEMVRLMSLMRMPTGR